MGYIIKIIDLSTEEWNLEWWLSVLVALNLLEAWMILLENPRTKWLHCLLSPPMIPSLFFLSSILNMYSHK